MVFPSIPAYLDPSNWQQQPNHHHHHHQQQQHQHQHQHGVGGGGGVSSQLLPPAPPPPPPPPPLPQPHGSGGGAGSIRPGSMADRARMANIPMPETQLKCPRCESSNTKFCYFNNYSLTQPRHFCKTCRRYWTRGGALRNVPVGGGCRRNKRSKGSGSSNKSPATSSDRQTASGASSSTLSSNSGPTTSDMLLGLGPQIPPLRFMAPLHHFNEFASSDHMGLNYPGLSCGPIGGAGSDLSFQIGTALAGLGGGGGGAGGSSLFGGGLEQWRNIQQGGGGHQFPFLGGLDSPSSGLYPFESGAEPSGYGIDLAGNHHNQVRPKMLITTSSIATQLALVKMEDSNQDRMNLSRQLLGINANNPVVAGNESTTPQYWSGPAWSTDLSSFSSSSTSNQL